MSGLLIVAGASLAIVLVIIAVDRLRARAARRQRGEIWYGGSGGFYGGRAGSESAGFDSAGCAGGCGRGE
jgi:hypothetical protein